MQNTFWSSESIQNYSIHKNIQNGIKEDNENEQFISKHDEILFKDFKYCSSIIENAFPSQNSTHSSVTTSESYTDVPSKGQKSGIQSLRTQSNDSQSPSRSPLWGQKSGSPSSLVDQNQGTTSPFRGQKLGTQSLDSRSPSRSPLRRQNQSPLAHKNKSLTPLDLTKHHTPRADPGQRGGNLKGELSIDNNEINLEHMNINDNNIDVYRAKKTNDVLISNAEKKHSSPCKVKAGMHYQTVENYCSI